MIIIRRRFVIVLLVCVGLIMLIVVLRLSIVRSDTHLGRLVFTNYVKAEHRYQMDVFDLDSGKLSSLQEERVQNLGFVSVIDGQHSYASMCFARNNPLFCSALVSNIVTPQDVQRFTTIRPFWKDSYGAPVWSPDGTHVAFSVVEVGTLNATLSSGDTYVMNADGTNLLDLSPQENINGFDFTWSPDSQQIAFVCGNAQYLCLSHVDGSHLQKLTMRPYTTVHELDWSPDGSQIVFTSAPRDNEHSEVDLVNADGSNLHTLIEVGADRYGGPKWSPDGSKIVFINGASGYADVYVIKPDGSDLHNLTQHFSGNNYGVVWSPDSLNVAFYSQQYQRGVFLYVADASRGNPHKVGDYSILDLVDVGAPELYWIP